MQPPCFEICGLAKQMQDELSSQKKSPQFKRLMQLYSEVFCVEMRRKKIPPNVKQWLSEHFREGSVLVRQLGGNLKKHKQIESIHTPNILKMVKGGSAYEELHNAFTAGFQSAF